MNKQHYTLGFIFNINLDKILLIKKLRSPNRLNNKMLNKLNGIGGHVEINESLLNCMIRECKEETGLNINNWYNFCNLDAQFGYIHCFYAITNDIYNYKQLEDEELKIYDLYSDIDVGIFAYNTYSRMHNIDWMIIMALNHIKKFDNTNCFEIKES